MNQSPFFDNHEPRSLSPRSHEKQQIADERELGLSVKPASPGNPTLDEEALSVYLETFNSDRLREVAELLVRKYLRKITFEELQNCLKKSVAILNQMIGDNPYNVLVERAHSTEWVAELALKHLVQMPSYVVNMGDYYVCDSESLSHSTTHVLFDDCAYSGKQLSENLESLFESINSIYSRTPQRLIIHVAFMTDFAKNRIQEKFETLKKRYSKLDLQFDLIVGENIPTISDLRIQDATERELLDVLGGPDAKDTDTFKRFCLIWTDWKRPDHISIPPYFLAAKVHNDFDRYDGLLLIDVPEKFRDPIPFFPKIKSPYRDKSTCNFETHFKKK